MNRFEEMIQQGKDIIARTKTLLEQEIDLNTAGTVDISVYLTGLKDIHKESLEFTNPDIAESLEQYKDGMSNEDYMEFLTQYLAVRAEIMGELRDRVYDRTSRIDMALNSKIEANNALHKEMAMLNEEIEAIRKDMAQIDSTIEILRNSNNESAIKPLEDAKKNMLERIAAKEKRIEDIKKEKEILLHGGVMPANEVDEEELEEERPPLPEEDEEEELAPLPEEDEDEEEHDEEDEHEHGEGAGFVPVFPELDEDEDELEEDEEEELEPLPEEDDDSDEAEEEEEEDEELAPVPTDDDEEIEVIHHTDAKPTLLRRIGNIVYAVITFLGSCAALVVTVDHFQNHHDIEPAQEEESQLDEDDLEENPAQDDEEQDDDLTQTPDDQTPDDQTPDDQTPSQDDDKKDDQEDEKDEDKEEDKDDEKDEEDELGALPAELAPGEFIFDRETGLEVGATGDAYVHVGDVTLEDEKKDLEATDHGTVIVDAEDMTTDQKLPELTGDELTYEQTTKDMTDQEISDLDAALAEWAAQFDSGLTLK